MAHLRRLASGLAAITSLLFTVVTAVIEPGAFCPDAQAASGNVSEDWPVPVPLNGQAANSTRSASNRQYQPAQAQTRMLSGSGHSAANHQTAKPKRHRVSGASAAWPSSSTLVPPPPPTMPSLSSLMAVPPPPVMLPYSYAGSVGASTGVSAANANLAPSYQPAYAARPAYHSPGARQYHPWSSYQQSSYSSVNNDNYGSLVVRAPIKKHRRRIIATR